MSHHSKTLAKHGNNDDCSNAEAILLCLEYLKKEKCLKKMPESSRFLDLSIMALHNEIKQLAD